MKTKVQLYVNTTKPHASELSEVIKRELIIQGYEIVESTADIIIGFGGDGTLLHFLRHNNYNTQASYIGVNCGTLGFLQDFNVEIEKVKEFVSCIPLYARKTLNFICIEIELEGKSVIYKALNEFVIQESEDKSFRTSVSVGGEFLEDFVGTGIIFSTPTGSTALNLSAGGCILHPNIQAIQMTPREAIANSKMHCLSKSILIPKELEIVLRTGSKQKAKIYSDGEKVYTGEYDKIRIYYSTDYIVTFTNKKDNFVKTIREKLI